MVSDESLVKSSKTCISVQLPGFKSHSAYETELGERRWRNGVFIDKCDRQFIVCFNFVLN